MADKAASKLSHLLSNAGLIDRIGDMVPGYVYIYDLIEQRNVYTNQLFAKKLGYSPAELESMGGQVLEKIVRPQDRAPILAHHERLRHAPEGAMLTLECQVQTRAGEPRWLNAWETVISRDDAGRPRHLLGVAHDVTDRVFVEEALRRSEQSLLASEQRWRSIAENPFDFVVVIDREYKYTYVNFVAPGLREEDLLGKATPFDFIDQSDGPRVRAVLEEVFATGKPTSYEVYVPSIDKWYSSLVGPIREGESVTQLSILTREITTEKRLEAEREARERELAKKNEELEQALAMQRALEAKLTQSAKLEAVGRLAGGIAHDFNNLLTGISGVASLIADRLPPGDPMVVDLADLREAVERGAGLTGQLLAFSRQQVIEQSILDLNLLVEDATRMLRRLIGESIELRFTRAPEAWLICCSRSQIEQVLMNLAVNAKDAMPLGGKLLIELGNVVIDENYCQTQPEATPGRFMQLSVSDTGVGMDAATQALIFEPFFTTKPVGTGTGLGLAIVYGVVRQSGGFVHVYSEPGHGTSFKLYLPVAKEQTTEGTTPPQVRARGTESILVVEDEQLVLRLAKRILESFGYSVLTAERGDDAIALIESGIEFDLLLTDVILPGCDGHTLSKRAAAIRPGIAIVFMSGYTDDYIAQTGIETSGLFLQKPFAPSELAAKVRAALDAHQRSRIVD